MASDANRRRVLAGRTTSALHKHLTTWFFILTLMCVFGTLGASFTGWHKTDMTLALTAAILLVAEFATYGFGHFDSCA